jgi:hypothetical protein
MMLRHCSILIALASCAFAQLDNGAYVSANYIGVLARNPDPGGWIWQKSHLDNGMSRDDMTSSFIGGPEFAYRRTLTSPQVPCSSNARTFVQCLYEAALKRTPSSGEIDGWVIYPQLNATQGIITSAESGLVNASAFTYRTDYVTPTHAAPVGTVAAGTQILLTVRYANAYGISDVQGGQIIVNAGTGPVNGAGACYIGWDYTGGLHLSYASVPTGRAGVAGPAMISPYCTIVPGNSSISTANGFSLTLAISFPASFTGAHTIYSFGTNREGLSSAWTPLGVLFVGTTSTNPRTIP